MITKSEFIGRVEEAMADQASQSSIGENEVDAFGDERDDEPPYDDYFDTPGYDEYFDFS